MRPGRRRAHRDGRRAHSHGRGAAGAARRALRSHRGGRLQLGRHPRPPAHARGLPPLLRHAERARPARRSTSRTAISRSSPWWRTWPRTPASTAGCSATTCARRAPRARAGPPGPCSAGRPEALGRLAHDAGLDGHEARAEPARRRVDGRLPQPPRGLRLVRVRRITLGPPRGCARREILARPRWRRLRSSTGWGIMRLMLRAAQTRAVT